MASYAVLFKAHYWNDDVQKQFDRLKASCREGHIYVALDAKCHPIDYPPSEAVFWISEVDLNAIGLYNHNGWWYNGDLPSILFFIKNPSYRFVVAVEYDVGIFHDIDSIVSDMYENNIDAIYHNLPEDLSQWPNLSSAIDYYNFRDIRHALFCISFFSRQALSCLYARRLVQQSLKDKFNLDTWPIGEAVMASEVNLSNLKYRKLSDYCSNLDNYNWNKGIIEELISFINPVNTFIHPISGAEKCVLSNTTPDIKKVDELVLIKASLVKRLDFYGLIYHFSNNTDNDRDLVLASARENLISVPSAKFLFGKILSLGASAYQSSESIYSRNPGEANNALVPLPGADYSFHTDFEDAPWWEVDLGEHHFVETIHIFDREDVRRSHHLIVFGGISQNDMLELYRNDGSRPIPGLNSGGLIINCGKILRFVRVSLTEPGMLHLNSVIISA